MKNVFILLFGFFITIILLFNCTPVSAVNPEIIYEKQMQGSPYYLNNIDNTEDEGYIISTPANDRIFYLTKVDMYGNTIFHSSYAVKDTAMNVIEIDDGFLVIGYDYIMNFDTAGNLQWKKNFSVYGGLRISHANDGGYLIVGSSFLLKLDKNGDEQWVESIEKELYGIFVFIMIFCF